MNLSDIIGRIKDPTGRKARNPIINPVNFNEKKAFMHVAKNKVRTGGPYQNV